MEDEELAILSNPCADLVSLKKCEAFPLHLLECKGAGEWVSVREACIQVGINAGDLKPDLFAAWLADPLREVGYAVISFYDGESKWTLAAHYNRNRLLAGALAGETPPSDKMTGTIVT